MSIISVSRVKMSGVMEASSFSVAPDGDGLVTADADACQVLIFPDGATIRGIRLVDNDGEWQPTDGRYQIQVRAESTYATLSMGDDNSGTIASNHLFSSPGNARSSFAVGPWPFWISYNVDTMMWEVPDWGGFPRPVGQVSMLLGPSPSVPPGYLRADGSNVSRTAYAALFAVYGTEYGAGDGSTTFGLPGLLDLPVITSGIHIIYAGA